MILIYLCIGHTSLAVFLPRAKVPRYVYLHARAAKKVPLSWKKCAGLTWLAVVINLAGQADSAGSLT